jgi:hypothetical protein
VVDVTITECPNSHTINRRQISVDQKLNFVTLGWLVVRRMEVYVGSKYASLGHFSFSGACMMRIRECNSDTESVMKMKVLA